MSKIENLNFYIVEDGYIEYASRWDHHIAYNKNNKRPYVGIVFKIKDVSTTGAYTNNVTIGRNGKLIDRQSNNASINTDSGAMELIYNSALGSWFSLSFIN